MFSDHTAGTWLSLGGFNAALSDRGGSYILRARTMAALTVGGAVVGTLGALVAGHLALALVATFVVAYVASIARVWGAPGVSIGGSMLTVYVVSLAVPSPDATHAFARAGFVVLGGTFAMIVALVLWPLRPYRPARKAVAACYRALAEYVDEVASAAEARHTGEWAVQGIAPTITTMRSALEDARAVLVQVRRGRPGRAERGERLLVLAEFADQLFGHAVAAGEMLSAVQGDAVVSDVHAAAIATLRQLATSAQQVAAQVEDEVKRPQLEIGWSGDATRAAIAAAPGIEPDAHYESLASILDRAAEFAAAAASSVVVLNGGAPAPAQPALRSALRLASAEEIPDEQGWQEMLRALWFPGSLMAHFALRVAVVTTAAVALTEVFKIGHGYWVTITVIVILQPYTGVTLTRAVQRVLGTLLGAFLAMALGALFHDPNEIMVIAAVFVAFCVALLPVNYAAYSVFLTPTFVLLAEASAGDWSLAPTRALNTLLGGALALLGSRLLWPSPEHARFPALAATAVRQVRAYLDATVSRYDDRSEEASQLMRGARRAVGLATVNVEESVQRALTEAHGDERVLAPALTVLAYLRRITASLAALSIARHTDAARVDAGLAAFHENAVRVLDDVAASLEARREPGPLPAFRVQAVEGESPLVRARVERLVRQIATLHDAVRRLATA